MVTEFDFKEEKSRIFGFILRPVARITLISNDLEVEEYVYVDSGADISLISKSVGELLGFKITEKDKVEEIKGIGERSVPMIVKEVKMKIGEKVFNAKIAWALIEEVPLLLGREDVFNLFNICFEKNKKVIFKE